MPVQSGDRPLIGLVLSEHKLFPLLKQAIQQLSSLGISVRGRIHDPAIATTEKWLRQLEQDRACAVWIMVTDTAGPAHQIIALTSSIPVVCQYFGGDARTRQAELLTQLPGAVFINANHSLDAVQFLAQLCAIRSSVVLGKLLQQRRSKSKEAQRETLALQEQIDQLAAGRPATLASMPAAIRTVPITPPSTPEDEELLQQIADSFKPRVGRKEDRPKPPAKAKVLDYSIPLRQMLTTARNIAGAYSHPAVQAEHLLAAILDLPETIAHKALLQAGADIGNLAGHLITHFPPPHSEVIPGVFALDDSANQVLAGAKQAARRRSRPCLTTLDFLEALALYASGAATSTFWESGVLATDIQQAIESFPASIEYEDVKVEEPAKLITTAELAEAEHFASRSGLGKKAVSETHEPVAASGNEPAAKPNASPDPPARPKVVVTTASMPGIEQVEHVSDVLLEGRLVALPIDTMFALAADATNPAAVDRLRSVANLEPDRPLGVLIHSLAQLRHVARGISTQASAMLDELWPGPLTVVFKKHPQGFLHLNAEPNLALRIPSDFLSLAILSNISRPLAVTSIDPTEPGGVLGAKQVADRLAGKIDAVLDIRDAPDPVVTTVLSMIHDTPKLLRQGAMPIEKLREYLPDLPAPESAPPSE